MLISVLELWTMRLGGLKEACQRPDSWNLELEFEPWSLVSDLGFCQS